MAWNATLPQNDSLLINSPGYIRANWEAISLGTDANLLLTNAKVAAGAAIVESKILFSASGHGHTSGADGKQIVLSTAVSGALLIGNGGTSQVTAQLAINALAGGVTANRVLRGNGTNILLAQVALATDVTGTLPFANGGTGLNSLGSALQVIRTNAGATAIEWGAGATVGSQLFTASGTFTAPTGVTKVYLTMVGGGGGAGGGQGAGNDYCGGGGGGGGAVIKFPYTVIPGSNYTVTVGTGGAGGAQATNGSNGVDTTFSGGASTITAKKGSFGTSVSAGVGIGGAGGANTINASTSTPGGYGFVGGNGGNGVNTTNGGAGGGSLVGVGAAVHATAAANSGGGGGGGDYYQYTGGSGGSGLVLVEY